MRKAEGTKPRTCIEKINNAADPAGLSMGTNNISLASSQSPIRHNSSVSNSSFWVSGCMFHAAKIVKTDIILPARAVVRASRNNPSDHRFVIHDTQPLSKRLYSPSIWFRLVVCQKRSVCFNQPLGMMYTVSCPRGDDQKYE